MYFAYLSILDESGMLGGCYVTLFSSNFYIFPCKLKVGVKGLTPIIDGDFHKRVIVDDSFWTLEDGEFGE